jgi:hypothetical protein
VTLRSLLVPATPTDRDIARKLWARLDVIHGYPRTHSASEPDVTVAQGAALPFTETLFSAWLHDATGAAALQGVVALTVDDPPAGMLARRLTYEATTRTLGEWIAWLEANRGWEMWTGALPGVAAAWTLLAVRDGEPGSTDGVPIPEGSE